MEEQIRPRGESLGPGPGGPGSLFGGIGDDTEDVTVCHGPYSESLPVGGMSVGEVRARFRDRLDIDPAAQPVVDGREVNDKTIVRAGQLLTFVRKAGEKGAVREDR
jgi:hypothetical protein